eukprot:CAMPEP_0194308454 /NCGR_PEP_ID=MMETSP0171-20130528/5423_1 /TAXON_ID=218684 /ORGANISM="Corethron pennatum, Strain L29A3" /LENGTH=315 /DNA_ID=CAMNT_0039061109 /DNA_START=261 /DNA_END=1208 /DNA_ORIENTATION=+
MEASTDNGKILPEHHLEEQTLQSEEDHPMSPESPNTIAALNILNAVIFVLNILVTYGIGIMNWLGPGTSNEALSLKYQTLVTPKGTAFSIWGIIFIAQGIFTVVQLLPQYRAHPMVVEGVRYWYILACLAQMAWTPFFALEIMPASLVCMVLIWAALLGLLYSQYYTPSDQTRAEFWLLRFPFQIHAGWITAATAVNTNVVVVWAGAAAAAQLAVGIVSLAVLHALAVWVLFVVRTPNYTIACVLAWANWWIHKELQDPKALITNTFTEDIVQAVAYASLTVSIIILLQIVIRVSLQAYQKRNVSHISTSEHGVQ